METVQARYVVGCDGARSGVRKSIGRHAVRHHGSFLHFDPALRAVFDANPSEFYLLARLITVACSLAMPVIAALFLAELDGRCEQVDRHPAIERWRQ